MKSGHGSWVVRSRRPLALGACLVVLLGLSFASPGHPQTSTSFDVPGTVGALPVGVVALGRAPDPGLRLASAPGSEAAVKQLKEQGLYDSLVAAVEATRYRVSPRPATGAEPDEFEGANPAQRFGAAFGISGVELRPTSVAAGWRLGLRLRAWGYGERLEPPGAARLAASGNRVEYRYQTGGADGLTEWYVNTARGIEQGFTLARRPAGGSATGPLTLVVAVTGDLAPRLAPAGQTIQLVSAEGTAVLGYSGLRAWDAAGQTLPSRLAVEAGHMRLVVDDAAAVYPVTVDPIVYSETKLAASGGAAGDGFGSSVAISGDTVVVGAPDHDTGGKTDGGQAYVYVRSGTVWTEQATLAASDGAQYDEFGSSVAISGDTVVVGAPGHDTGGQADAGQAYVYVRSGAVWTEQATLAASDGAAGDRFGWDVAISGDTVVVGEPYYTIGNTSPGQAYVYVRSGAVWTEQATLAASDGATAWFGWSVAIDGDTVVVGAVIGGQNNSGQAYVYVRSGTVWSEQATLAHSSGAWGDQFGFSVAISGDTVVVGAPEQPPGGRASPGQAYVYVRSGTVWTEQAMLAASNGVAYDYFGFSVAISGDTVVVGAPGHATGGQAFAGQAYVYVRSGTAWTEQATLAASNGVAYDQFGWEVAIDGDTVVVGAPLHATQAGQAYVYVRTLFEYTLSNSGDITLTQGASGSNTITATLTSNSTSTISFSVSGLPSGATASFNPTACSPTCSTTLTITTATSTPSGTYSITVAGTPLNKTTTFTLKVDPAFNYTLTDSGGITVIQGAAGSNTITATLTSGSAQSVSFSASGLPSGATASFNPTACAPTCSTQLTISTSVSTPTGTVPITVTGSPLNRTTTFNLEVTSPGPCPVTTALHDAPNATAKLAVLYDFRDKALTRTPAGSRYANVFYQHAAEGVWLMLRYPELRSRSRALLERFLPSLRAVVARQSTTLTAADLASIESLLGAFATHAGPGLRADIGALQRELRQGTILRDLGITIKWTGLIP